MYKKLNKIMASLLVFVMVMANISTLGIHLGEVIASDVVLNGQDSKTNNKNIEFDVAFVEENTTTHDAIKKIGEENKIVAKVSVKNAGYLKDARIDFEQSNFTISDQITSEKVTKIENNGVVLNQINANEEIAIEFPFSLEHNEIVNLSEFNKTSKAKFTARYVDGNGSEHEIKKDISLGLKWTADVENEISSEVTKYIPYDVNGQKGLIVQMILKESIKDNVLPLKESNIEILMPEINSQKPSDVKLNTENSNVDYNYDEETNKLTVTTRNIADEDNNINWLTDSKREYEITCIYKEEAITEGEVKINANAKSDLIVYSYDEKQIEKDYQEEIVLKDKIGEIVDFKVETDEMLSKGYMYSNFDIENKNETLYNQNVEINISMPELVDRITLKLDNDTFTGEKVKVKANSYYKTLKISKSEILKFFGEEGQIDIYSGDKVIANVLEIIKTKEEDKSEEAEKAEDNEIISVELNADDITVVTTKPIVEGKLKLEFEKAIKKESNFTKKDIGKFAFVESNLNVKIENQDYTIMQKDYATKVALVEPLLQTQLEISNKDLSTVITNENVELRTVLKTSSEYNKLFKNPVIVFTLPEYIENINVKNVQVLFDDELTVKSSNVVNNQIIIELEGAQTKYSKDSIYGGTHVVVNTDITLDKLTPSIQAPITMEVISNDEKLTLEDSLNLIAPSGVVAVNRISNFVEGQEIMAVTQDESGTLAVQASAQNATEEIEVINNYNNRIENVEILGRTLSTNTTNPTTGESINNSLNVPMQGPIDRNGQENVNVYYSSNGSADRNLNNPENGWTEESQVVDYSQVRSYLIVLDRDDAMETGEVSTFSYDMQIPENLNYSETSSSLYTVYFDNVQENQIIEDRVTSRLGTITTGTAPQLQVTVSSDLAQNSVVKEGQFVRFTATVTNTGTIDAQNVKLKIAAPEVENQFETEYAKYDPENFSIIFETSENKEVVINYPTLKVGETKTKEYYLKINNVAETTDEKILNATAKVIADDMQTDINSNEYKLKVEDGNFSVIQTSEILPNVVIKKGTELPYITRVESTKDETIQNVVVKVPVARGLFIKSAEYRKVSISDTTFNVNIDINNNNNEVTFTIAEYPGKEIIDFTIYTEVETEVGELTVMSTVTADNIVNYSNSISNKVGKLELDIKQSQLDNSYVNEGSNVTFEYVITNTSEVQCDKFTLENPIPDGLKAVSETIEIFGESTTLREYAEDKIVYEASLLPKTTMKLRLEMKANLLPEGQTQRVIKNSATLSGDGFDTIKTNEVQITVEYDRNAFRGYEIDPNDPTDPRNDDNPIDSRIISGIAWLDSNQDGERNDDEELVPAMQVRLLNKETNEFIDTTATGLKGEYTFSNVAEGEYIVVFLYESDKYLLTEYNKAGVSQSTNSDAISFEMNIDGEDKIVGVTDTIKITDSNARNIDIGIYEHDRSDLKLDKYISALSITYGNTVKNYTFDNVKVAKAEIPANSLSDATVIVEYKIVVKNQGAITNYVKKIVDYMPKDMKFNSELNRDWYQSSNGDLYNSSLANTALGPGESKEVTLTLTKKMTSNNTGIINNNAELYEVYNEEGIRDFDSTPANKVSGEDDMSAADLVIGVKTGDAVIYTIIISIIICSVVAISVYVIRKTLLKEI